MDFDAKDRALERLDHLLEAHRAAVESIRIASRSDGFSDQLVVSMQTYYEFTPGNQEGYKRRVLDTIQRAKQIDKGDFLYQRSMLLVALCSLLDVAVKDIVAEQLAKSSASLLVVFPQEVRNELADKVSRHAGLGVIAEEIFPIVDFHFRRCGTPKTLKHAQRYRYWLALVGEEPIPDNDVDSTINQAIQVRNLAIHRSESASAALAAVNSRFWDANQKEIRLGSNEITDITNAFRHFLHGIGSSNL